MSVDVFESLDPNVIYSLTVTNVQGLLGEHLPDLKLFENDTLIQTWVNLQLQSDLDTMGVGLINNKTSPTTAEPGTSTVTGTTSTSGAGQSSTHAPATSGPSGGTSTVTETTSSTTGAGQSSTHAPATSGPSGGTSTVTGTTTSTSGAGQSSTKSTTAPGPNGETSNVTGTTTSTSGAGQSSTHAPATSGPNGGTSTVTETTTTTTTGAGQSSTHAPATSGPNGGTSNVTGTTTSTTGAGQLSTHAPATSGPNGGTSNVTGITMSTSGAGTSSTKSTTTSGTSGPSGVTNSSDVCASFTNSNDAITFLMNEIVSDDRKKVILPCVWKFALSSTSLSEANIWFDVRLKTYLKFLTKSLISPTEIQNASCFAFKNLVSYMDKKFIYTGADFVRVDVYATIRSYLGHGSGFRCYDPSVKDLSSTSWFVDYIGGFVTNITLGDLTNFVSTSQVQAVLENQDNLNLFNNTIIPPEAINYYITQLFSVNPTFSLLKLPGILLCSSNIPSSTYLSLNEADTMVILDRRKQFCGELVDPEVNAALVSNFKITTITTQTFVNLGKAASSLTITQLTSVSTTVLTNSLSTLAKVTTWSQDKATIIVQAITTSGYQINSAASLESLGYLVVGIPSKSLGMIPAAQLLSASKNPTLISNIVQAPIVLQETFVKQIISVDRSAATVVQNVPGVLAPQIPPSVLVFPPGTADINILNTKSWTQDQASMVLLAVAETDFDTEQLSLSVLQGFTCTAARQMTKTKVKQLIYACRPRAGRAKLQLKESQLTCMYNLLKGDLSQNFTDYPSDLLLYFSSKDVQKSNCRSYFSALGAADFTVPSSILNKGQQLLSDARTCLGIKGTSLSQDHLNVLGNMVCILDSSYILNSDPLILENLKACKDFSNDQITAIETVLLSGKTKYGNVATWSQQTLTDLENLPLFLTKTFWSRFQPTIQKSFLKVFMPALRSGNTPKQLLKQLFNQFSSLITKRGAGCTVGNITTVTVSDPSFPFDYDLNQFDLCLDVPVLIDNLNAICAKVDADSYQTVILQKLNQAYPAGVPDQVVENLGSVSRMASLQDISKWSITTIDTLASLMKTEDGPWNTTNSKEIIMKYLSTSGNSLGSSELNIIDSNLCSLDTSTLRTITPDSIMNAKLLNVSSCSLDQKRVLYNIRNTSLSSLNTTSQDLYTLIKGYLGGAPLTDIVALSTQNISMSVDIFKSLDPNVINSLTVPNVLGLMGGNVPDLKLFENNTLIQEWINSQKQSDLDTMGVGLVTTRVTNLSTAAPSSSGALAQGNSSSSNTTQATTAASTSGGQKVGSAPTFVVLSVLLTGLLQILQLPA